MLNLTKAALRVIMLMVFTLFSCEKLDTKFGSFNGKVNVKVENFLDKVQPIDQPIGFSFNVPLSIRNIVNNNRLVTFEKSYIKKISFDFIVEDTENNRLFNGRSRTGNQR